MELKFWSVTGLSEGQNAIPFSERGIQLRKLFARWYMDKSDVFCYRKCNQEMPRIDAEFIRRENFWMRFLAWQEIGISKRRWQKSAETVLLPLRCGPCVAAAAYRGGRGISGKA